MSAVTSEVFYEAFRRFLVKQLRFYDDPAVVHVGEVSGCLRRAWYNRVFGDRELRHLAKTKYVVLGLGLSTHMVLEEVLREVGYAVERPLSADLGGVTLVGTPDAVNGEHVIEIKTVSKTPQQPYPQHLLQANAYMALTGAPQAYIVYINKRSGDITLHRATFSERLWRLLKERAATLAKALATGTPPPPERGPWCSFCDWQLKCSLGWEL